MVRNRFELLGVAAVVAWSHAAAAQSFPDPNALPPHAPSGAPSAPALPAPPSAPQRLSATSPAAGFVPVNAPNEIPYKEGEPGLPGYRLRVKPRQGPIIGGAILIGIPYTLGAVVLGSTLVVPVAGPWIQLAIMGKRGCAENDEGICDFLVFSGVLQGAGALLIAAGFAVPRRTWVRQSVSVSVLPTALGPRAYGLGAVGTF